MGQMAARIGDDHKCPKVDPPPHVGGPIVGGSPDVITGGMSQARVGDAAVCVGPLDKIRKGSDTVFVNGKQAARMGDPTDVGAITGGCSTVFIGDSGGGGGGSALADASDNATPFAAPADGPGGTVGDLSQDNVADAAGDTGGWADTAGPGEGGDAFSGGEDGAGGAGGDAGGGGDGAGGGAPGGGGVQTQTFSCPTTAPMVAEPPTPVSAQAVPSDPAPLGAAEPPARLNTSELDNLLDGK